MADRLATRPTTTVVRAGNLQAARQGLPFPAQLTARVADTAGQPVAGARVVFRVCSGGASFIAGARSATAVTNAAGVATAPVLDAGADVGSVRVTAMVPGSAGPATYTLRVLRY